ncbi:hypothetical protein B5X24_HaOG214987 [Helicoverpa armigera]|nr:hypothetical protein B5X24_HaOG214987 [Helicoverpa armigera]
MSFLLKDSLSEHFFNEKKYVQGLFQPRWLFSYIRSASCAGHIIMHEHLRRHNCTHYSSTLIARWDGNPTRPERDRSDTLVNQ